MLRAVDRRSDLSLYAQVKQQLREMIENEEWLPGQMIPTEKELELQLGVSRSTVRQALQEMVHDGLIRRHAGKGTFVAPAKIEDRTHRVGGLVQQRYGYRAESEILEFREVPPTAPQVLKYLDVHPGSRVLYFKRLLLEDGVPFGLSTVHVLLGKDVSLTKADLVNFTITQIVRTHGVAKVVRSERSLEAVLASELEQRILQVPPSSPLLLSRSTSYADTGERVGVTKAVYRGDRFRYSFTVTY